MRKITPYLWFDNNAEEAVNFYISLFPDAKWIEAKHYPADVPGIPAGSFMGGSFQLAGQEFLVLNGGPAFKFNEAISFYVDCADQAEVDELWNKLCAGGGQESQCGWCKDKYGLSWQIIPKALTELMSDPDPEKAGRVMQAMLKMQKIDVTELEKAYRGE